MTAAQGHFGRRRGDARAKADRPKSGSFTAFAEATRVLARRLREAPDLEAALEDTVQAVVRITASIQATVRLLDPTGERLLLRRRVGPAVVGSATGAFHFREGFLGWVLEHEEVAFANRPGKDPRFVAREDQRWMPTAVLAAPLPGRKGPIGTLSAARDDGRPYRPTDAAKLAVVAELAAAYLEAGRQERLALTDDLTLLLNKRHGKAALPQAVEAARTAGHPLSLVLLDLDHFGKVNKRHGVDVGDAVLREAAARLRAACRTTDVAIRWGGEEFVVVLPDTPAAAARRVAQRIRQMLAAAPAGSGGDAVPVTGSLGVATLRKHERPQELLRRADRALREAKRLGRNRVVAWSRRLDAPP